MCNGVEKLIHCVHGHVCIDGVCFFLIVGLFINFDAAQNLQLKGIWDLELLLRHSELFQDLQRLQHVYATLNYGRLS